MIRLVSQFMDGVQNGKEYQRLIAREKLMIDPMAIVLPRDFFLNAVDPLIRRGTYFGRLFERGKSAMNDSIERRIAARDVTFFRLTFDQLDPAMQVYVERAFREDRVAESMEAAGVPGVTVEGFTYYDAVYMEDLFDSINRRYIQANALKTRETVSVLLGEGRPVLEFWRNVRALKDYSPLFPHKPRPPRRDNQERKPERVHAGGMKPVWGGGF